MSPFVPEAGVPRPESTCIADTPRPQAGLHFSVAETLEDVTDAWHLLYRTYRRAGFIAANPYDLHTAREAIGEQTAVIVSRIQGLTVGTISAILDTPKQLPLDGIYPEQLRELRQEGKKLMEVGLLGDRREGIERSFVAVLELMRYTFWFGHHHQVTDFICGIPPRWVKLYTRAFGFDIACETMRCTEVEKNPLVLLRSNTAKAIANRGVHKAIDYFLEHPLGTEVFAKRFGFFPGNINGTLLEKFLGTCP